MKVPCWAVGVGGRSDDAEEEQEGKGPRCARATASWSSSSSHAAGSCAVVVRWQGVSKKDAWFERAMACAPNVCSSSSFNEQRATSRLYVNTGPQLSPYTAQLSKAQHHSAIISTVSTICRTAEPIGDDLSVCAPAPKRKAGHVPANMVKEARTKCRSL